jgi:hypothetical protein
MEIIKKIIDSALCGLFVAFWLGLAGFIGIAPLMYYASIHDSNITFTGLCIIYLGIVWAAAVVIALAEYID